MHVYLLGAARIASIPLARLHSLEERVGLLVFTLSLLFAMTHSLLAHEYKAGSIEVVHPWSRATPDAAKVAAGYLTINNTGSQPDRLVSASGTIAGKTEIHEMGVDGNGVMTMRPVESIEIPANGGAELKPGSYHIMFMSLTEGAVEGRAFKGSLTFEKAGKIEVEFAVEAVGGSASRGHDGNEETHGAHDGHAN